MNKYLKLHNKNIFEFLDYKLFLSAIVKNKSITISAMAAACDCQRSHISRVIRGKLQLTLDQTFSLAVFLGMAEKEVEYFKTLVEVQRASSLKYRQFLSQHATKLRQHHLDLRYHVRNSTIDLTTTSQNPDHIEYFRNWYISAIHFAVSIPEYQTVESLIRRFNLPKEIIMNTLMTLQRLGYVKNENSLWRWKSGDLHISREHPMISVHHGNWIHKAQDSIARGEVGSIHYSVVQSLSKNDFERVMGRVSDWVREFGDIAGPSKPEELICVRFDLFKVK